MFDIGWQELFIVAVLAILVVGPRDLPRTLRTVMSYVRKAKGMAREFQNGIDEVAREVELDDIRQEANKIAHMDLEKEVKDAVDPTGSLNEDLDMSDVQSAIQDSANAMNTATEAAPGETTSIESTPDASEVTPEAAEPASPEPELSPDPASEPTTKANG